MNQIMDSRTRTPQEKLIFEKEQIRLQCLQKEDEISERLSYVHDHAGSMLLSGVSALIFPKTKTSTKKSLVPHNTPGAHPSHMGFADYLSIAKDMLPSLMEIAKPLLFTWGLKSARKWIFRLIRGK